MAGSTFVSRLRFGEMVRMCSSRIKNKLLYSISAGEYSFVFLEVSL
jgi:hypothetical protein